MRGQALPARWSERALGLLTLSLLAVSVSVISPAGATAATIEVTSTANAGPGTLRAAIAEANEANGGDTIEPEAAGTISLASELPPLKDDLVIEGPSPEALTVARSSNAASGFPVFTVLPNATIKITDLTISGGEFQTGGGIRNLGNLTLEHVYVTNNRAGQAGGTTARASGGGIYSTGKLVVKESWIYENTAIATIGTKLTEASGAGIAAVGGATVWRSTISGNFAAATSYTGTVRAIGGGIELESGPQLIELSTVASNTASAAGPASVLEARGGGIYAKPGPGFSLTLSGSTIAYNAVSGPIKRGANVESGFGSLVRDTIIAGPKGAPSCGGPDPLPSAGFNLDEDGSCRLNQPSDLSRLNPGMSEQLAANEAFVPTLALTPTSVAINKGNAFGATIDERGKPRPAPSKGVAAVPGGDGSDIGAYELQGSRVDTTPPQTVLDVEPPRNGATPRAYFVFHAPELGARFQCKLDGGPYKACRAPFRAQVSADSSHGFSVRAIDTAGNVDRTPARSRFRVR